MSEHEHDDSVDPAVTPQLFRQWRSPRRGKSNPERLDNPVWEWLVKSRLNAYLATERMQGPSAMDAGPGWCFDRFGQSITLLPDGRKIFIAGEHEDHYDPDFFIYNDVVVETPDGIEIFGYPTDVFPPTDFHSATLAGNRIVIIGNLGYQETRQPGVTPVFILQIDTWAICSVITQGATPGWIHKHQATLSENGASIVVRGGKLDRGDPDHSLVENIDDWRLHLADWRWERLTERRWQRWEFIREDGECNHLWDLHQAHFARQHPVLNTMPDIKKEFGLPSLEEELGGVPDLDLVEKLYSPAWPHEPLPSSDEEYNVHRIRVAGVVVRYVEEMHSVQMTVEGELPPLTLEALTSDLRAKLSALENAPFAVKPL
jgi:hypothetical protein